MLEYHRPQLKAAARQAMRGQRPHPMFVTFVFSILAGVGGQIISQILGLVTGSTGLNNLYVQAFMEYGDVDAAVQYALMSYGPQRLIFALLVGGGLSTLLVALWQGLMRVGYSGFCLDMVRGRQPQTGALFRAFPQAGPVLITQLLVSVFRFLWGLLLGVGFAVILFVDALLFIEYAALFVLIALAAYLAFLVGIVWITLRYAMVDFLVADRGITGMEAIRESKRLMQGNIGKLFTLNLSFIGWYLLEVGVLLILGAAVLVPVVVSAVQSGADSLATLAVSIIGALGLFAVAAIAIGVFNLWLTPYITGAQALFYDWTQGIDSTRPTPGGGSGGWGQPTTPRQNTTYTWNPTPGPTSGTGIGPGSQDGGAPKPPQSPKDDPWG